MTPRRAAERHLQRAEHLLEVGRPGEAIKELEQSLALRPEDSVTLCYFARAYLALKDHARTLQYARRALAADPQNEWALRLQACALLGQHKRKDAYTAATRAVELDPENAEALYLLALCAFELDRVDEAVMLGEILVAQRPTSVYGFVILGDAAASRNDHDAASRHFEKVLELDPTHDGAMEALASLRNAHRRYGESVSLLRAAVGVNPRSAARQSVLHDSMKRFALFGEPRRRSRSVAGLLALLFLSFNVLGSTVAALLGDPEWLSLASMYTLPVIVAVALPLLRSRFFAAQSEQLHRLYLNATRLQRRRTWLTCAIVVATAYGIAGIVYLEQRDPLVLVSPLQMLAVAVWIYMLAVTLRLVTLWIADTWSLVAARLASATSLYAMPLWALPGATVAAFVVLIASSSAVAGALCIAGAIVSVILYYRHYPLATSAVLALLGAGLIAYDFFTAAELELRSVGTFVGVVGLGALLREAYARVRRHRQRQRIGSLVGQSQTGRGSDLR